ncbi:MAG: SMI1/KNR4 family protein, partial [Solirubrobacterales bacterium]
MNGLIKFKALINTLNELKLQKLDSEGKKIEVRFELNEAASLEDIKNVEKELGVRLPDSYKEFLMSYNGARIFDYDGLDGFIVLGTKDISKANKFAQATFEEDWIESILIFAKYIGESNYLGFDVSEDDNEYKVIDCYF